MSLPSSDSAALRAELAGLLREAAAATAALKKQTEAAVARERAAMVRNAAAAARARRLTRNELA
jgi:hypothetical protein